MSAGMGYTDTSATSTNGNDTWLWLREPRASGKTTCGYDNNPGFARPVMTQEQEDELEAFAEKLRHEAWLAWSRAVGRRVQLATEERRRLRFVALARVRPRPRPHLRTRARSLRNRLTTA